MTASTDLDDTLANIRARAEAATEGPWEESWRPIAGCDGYEVSDFGNVRSHWSKGNHKAKRAPFPRTLKARISSNGYPSVSLPKPSGGYKNRSVHRLVAEAFIGPAPSWAEVAHLNGDRSDARASNLAYVTHRENEVHKKAHGTSGEGERNSQAKLQGWQVAEVKYLAAKSVPQCRIADLFGMDPRTISAILGGKAWASVEARADVPRLLDLLDEQRAVIAEMQARLADRERQHADRLAKEATIGDAGICRTCALPITFTTVEEPGFLPRTGWSDGARRDALVCFGAISYRHVPLVGRERGIWDAATKAATTTDGSEA